MTPVEVQQRAQELAELYSDYEWIGFYKKCVMRLPEGKIQYIVESASKSSNPRNYFKKAARKEMK